MTTPDPHEAFRASHKAMLEMLVQLYEEVVLPLDALIPEMEAVIAIAERLERSREKP